jgi:cation diffusion facilitator CzcD-associated flavoprotein CzcO
MAFKDCTQRYCIVGAGSSGLAAAKNLKEFGVPFDCIEREDDVGGNWYFGKPNSSVYRSTHLISSKPLTEYTDFPMPKNYPDYPSHAQVWEYFKSYARHYGLYEHIEFNIAVEKIEAVNGGQYWDVTLSDGETRRYGGLVVANGHNWHPKYPQYPGNFTGIVLHSADYKTPDVLRDRRVMVVGAGNSGCDIAVESAQNAAKTFHSSRRGYYYVPKYVFGLPADQVGERSLALKVPLPIRRFTFDILLKAVVGNPADYGLPKPDHRLFETHPIINSQMLYYVGHGDIIPKGDIAEFDGNIVRFKDGTSEEIDVIVYATGFNITFPFMDKQYLNWQNNRPKLYMNVFHPQYDNLFVAGLIQPDSGQWGLVDWQSKVIARFIWAQTHDPAKAQWFRGVKAGPQPDLSRGIKYLESTRHYLEVEHFSYRTDLKKLVKKFDIPVPQNTSIVREAVGAR